MGVIWLAAGLALVMTSLRLYCYNLTPHYEAVPLIIAVSSDQSWWLGAPPRCTQANRPINKSNQVNFPASIIEAEARFADDVNLTTNG